MKDSRKRLLLMALKNKRQLNADGKLVIDNQIDFMCISPLLVVGST